MNLRTKNNDSLTLMGVSSRHNIQQFIYRITKTTMMELVVTSLHFPELT